MQKKILGIAAGILAAALCFGAAHRKERVAFALPSPTETYLYIDSIVPSQKTRLSEEDQARLLDILHGIKYQEPSIDLSAEEFVRYGFTYCAAEFVTDDGKTEFYISNYEVAPDIRKVYCSASPAAVPAYVPESLYAEYEALFRDYGLETAE